KKTVRHAGLETLTIPWPRNSFESPDSALIEKRLREDNALIRPSIAIVLPETRDRVIAIPFEIIRE
ncbi:MAG: hypothetical protein LC729_03880, partial [Acidobacteria bacterium]|nr:hypothetical protein [Acidobacteriota bacterium]